MREQPPCAVHSFGWGQNFDICALRPTGVYGVAHPVERSKWFELVTAVVRGDDVVCRSGGKEVHAADVARAAGILLDAPDIRGEVFNCYDRYISEYDVATIAKRLTASPSRIDGQPKSPRHQIATDKIQALGMRFGGTARLEATIEQMIQAVTATTA